jgi:hypothetical protein
MACPQPVADRYEPGDEVTVVGYTNGCVPNVDEGTVLHSPPLYGYLLETADAEDPSSGIELGRYSIEDTRHEPRGYRMRLRFTLPDDIEPGRYYVHTCERPCDTVLVYGPPRAIYVGVDPQADERPVRGWPFDDPAVADLDGDALLLGTDGESITAAEVRSAGAGDDEQAGLDEDDVAIADEADPAGGAGARDEDPDEGHGGHLQLTVMVLVLGGLALAIWVVINRRTGGRKQIRRGPSGP